MIAADLVSLLRGHRFGLSSEGALQRGIEHLPREAYLAKAKGKPTFGHLTNKDTPTGAEERT